MNYHSNTSPGYNLEAGMKKPTIHKVKKDNTTWCGLNSCDDIDYVYYWWEDVTCENCLKHYGKNESKARANEEGTIELIEFTTYQLICMRECKIVYAKRIDIAEDRSLPKAVKLKDIGTFWLRNFSEKFEVALYLDKNEWE